VVARPFARTNGSAAGTFGAVPGSGSHATSENPMLIHVIIVLIVVGILLWLVNNYIPMDGKIKSILNAVVVIVVILWLLEAFGLLSGLGF
jgi:hypothetical protein